jgi:ABC-type lipoprotein export system ATPase subunit
VSDAKEESILEAKGLSKSFRLGDGSIEVLSESDILLKRASSLSIQGDSGCGKTTLLNLLARLESADEGTIRWDGYEMDATTSPSSKESLLRADFLGVVYQAYYLIPELDVLENVLMAARLCGPLQQESVERARFLLSSMGVGSKEKQIPTKLSGGERQRVAIARALINKPAVLLADEPTGNLDERTGGQVMELLLNACEKEKTALVLVTHNPSFAKAAMSRIVLRQGKLSETEGNKGKANDEGN